MTSTPTTLSTTTRGVPRRLSAVLRLAAGLLVLTGITTQVIDLSLHDALAPEEYFSYFTIQSNLMIIVVLLVGGVVALRQRADTELLATVAAAVVPYAVVTGVVYNLLLRGLPAEGYRGAQWPNEVMHVVIPIVVLVDWIVSAGRPRLRWRTLLVVAAYPIAWLVFTMIRGAATGWYPYPFLEPGGPAGMGGVLAYVVVLTSFIVALGALVVARTRGRALVR